MLTRMFLAGSQLAHFAAASLIRSTYLRCAFSFVRKRVIVGRRGVQEVAPAVKWLICGNTQYSPLQNHRPIDIQRF
jgi:hypothetical protein